MYIKILFLLFSMALNAQVIEFQNFEGTGTPSGWTVQTGTPDFDYTTAPAPLNGLQSFAMNGASGTKQVFYALGANYTELYFSAIIRRQGTNPGGTAFLFQFELVTTMHAYLGINTSSQVIGNHGTVTTTSSRVLSADSTYYIWCHYKDVTVSGDGVLDVWVSTTGWLPDTKTISISTGDYNGNIDRIWHTVSASAGRLFIYDDITYSTTMPGNFIEPPVENVVKKYGGFNGFSKY